MTGGLWCACAGLAAVAVVACSRAAGAQSQETGWPRIDLRLSNQTIFQDSRSAGGLPVPAVDYATRTYEPEPDGRRLEMELALRDGISVLLPAKQLVRPLRKEFVLVIEIGF